jgi:mercuric ion binding protein
METRMNSRIFLGIAILAASLIGAGHAHAMLATNTGPDLAQAQAAHQETVSFDIENMTCATCPITVRTAMSRVEGVQNVEVDFETKIATVEFDPAVTTAQAIGAASTNAGYPAHQQDQDAE